mgnify:CR=1 FL=1
MLLFHHQLLLFQLADSALFVLYLADATFFKGIGYGRQRLISEG